MRFRLRTLLIVVTLACGVFAAVGQFGLDWTAMVALMLVMALPFTPLPALLLDWLATRRDNRL